jgi:hypothetical protein
MLKGSIKKKGYCNKKDLLGNDSTSIVMGKNMMRANSYVVATLDQVSFRKV